MQRWNDGYDDYTSEGYATGAKRLGRDRKGPRFPAIAALLAALVGFPLASMPAARASAADSPAPAVPPPAVQSARQKTPERSAYEAQGYRLSPGDVIDVSVMDKPELTRQVTVLPDGVISYPYLGQIDVEGMTIKQLSQRITKGLSTQISRPQVTVNVAKRQLQEASVLGAVRSQGKRPLGDDWHVLDLIADAGGLSVDRPEWAKATLVRGAGASARKIDLTRVLATGDPSENVLIQSGDVLLIEKIDEALTHVEVLGEVAKPGLVPTPRDGSLSAVLLAVGGPTERAALMRASIERGGRNGKTIPLDLSRYPVDGSVPENVKLEPGDTLIIPRNAKVYSVLGAVARAGTMAYPEDHPVTAFEALTMAGGVIGESDQKKAELIRPNPQGGDPTIIDLDVTKLLKSNGKPKPAAATGGGAPVMTAAAAPASAIVGSATNPLLQPGDVLYIPPKGGGGRQKFGLNDAWAVASIAALFGL